MQKFSDTIASTVDGVLVPLSTANITVRLAGTGTSATLYADSAGLTPLANPFQSSATGRAEFYAADGRYDIQVAKAGYSTVTVSDVLLEDPDDGANDDLDGVNIANAAITGSTFAGGSVSEITSLTFSATPGVLSPRMMTWNQTDETVDLQLNGSAVTLQVGQEVVYRVRNQTGSTITDGSCVSAAGTTGNAGRILVQLAIANGSVPHRNIMGLATEDILNGSDGFVTHFGKVRGINTTGASSGETWVDGDVLFAHPTQAGKLTKVRPSIPNQAVVIAIVVNAASNGSLFVRAIRESHESDTTAFTPVSGPVVSVQAAIRDLQARVTALETP